mmetsp:Transcript_127305/g.179681  ORF Transcript_127305/g.179681 Transcript_127305/m.179681 type:complete len:205 (-) Transcript_127305:615-1229(-)
MLATSRFKQMSAPQSASRRFAVRTPGHLPSKLSSHLGTATRCLLGWNAGVKGDEYVLCCGPQSEILLPRCNHHRPHLRIAVGRRRAGTLASHIVIQNHLRIRATLVERYPPRAHEVHDEPESIDVDLLIVVLMTCHFWGHIAPGTQTTCHLECVSLSSRRSPTASQIPKFQLHAARQEEVQRLQVSMNHRHITIVQEVQRPGYS